MNFRPLRTLGLLLTGILIVSCSGPGGVIKAAPAFRVEAYGNKGQFIDLAAMKGKVVMLDFWATWCGPCRESMPHVKAIYEELKSKGFEVMGVTAEERASVNKFFTDHSVPYPIFLDGDHSVNEAYDINEIPTAVVIDRQGNVVFSGHPEDAELRPAIERALAQS